MKPFNRKGLQYILRSCKNFEINNKPVASCYNLRPTGWAVLRRKITKVIIIFLNEYIFFCLKHKNKNLCLMKLNLKLRVKSETINQKYSFKDNEMKTLLKYLLNCCQLSS